MMISAHSSVESRLKKYSNKEKKMQMESVVEWSALVVMVWVVKLLLIQGLIFVFSEFQQKQNV